MNFLLHHRLALRDLASTAAAAGAMLPDLWRMADRRVFARSVEGDGADEQPAVREVLAGIEHHAAVDRWFHAAAVFKEGEIATSAALRSIPGARRLRLFAHIAWELCLDGALVRSSGREPVQAALRESIAAVRPFAHRRAVDLHHFQRAARTDEDRARFEQRLGRIFDELGRGPWVAAYQTSDGVAGLLEGVRSRLRFEPFTPGERAAVASALEGLGERADVAFRQIIGDCPPC